MKYVVQYTLPYEHVVQVGIDAETPEKACAKAEELFDAGTIWDDTKEAPLLQDDFVEIGGSGDVLEFTIENECSDGWPERDGSVTYGQAREHAMKAARLLVDICNGPAGDGVGAFRWNDLDEAYELALLACGGKFKKRETATRK